MGNLSQIVSETSVYCDLEKAIKDSCKNIVMDNVSLANMSFMASLLCQKIDKNILIITSNENTASRIISDLENVFDKESIYLFPAREMVYNEFEAVSNEYERQRLKVLCQLLGLNGEEAKGKIVVTYLRAILQPLILSEDFREMVFKLEEGTQIKFEQLSSKLVKLGYVKSKQVDGAGQFSIRGDIVDIFPVNLDSPVRIDFWGEEIDSIFLFDVATQRKIGERLKTVSIGPAHEVIIKDKKELTNKLESLKIDVRNEEDKERLSRDIEMISKGGDIESKDKYIGLIFEDKNSIIDYIDHPVIFLEDEEKIIESSRAQHEIYLQNIKEAIHDDVLINKLGRNLLSWDDIQKKLAMNITAEMNSYDKLYAKSDAEKIIHSSQRSLSPWNGDIGSLIHDLKDYKQKNFKVMILTNNKTSADRLINALRENSFLVSDRLEDLESYVVVKEGVLSSGVEYTDDKLVIITEQKNLSKVRVANNTRRKKSFGDIAINSLEDLSLGDYVVHVNHGIGVFDGISKIELDKAVKDYIKIRYAGEDVLYVPATQLDLVSKYIGNQEDRKFKVNKLNSVDWLKKKTSVKKAVKDIAKDLIKLQQERMKLRGHAFSEDTPWQRQFEDQFEYQETEDQLRCIREIKEDMEDFHPMDRLLCGDVGVGKTEVALRMAFKAVMDGKQVAILAPTTILSWQHYNTIRSRFSQFPIKIEILSRLKTPKEQKVIVEKLKSGEIEIVVGTHRLLQKDIDFKDLGLIIIDEEQRFGVADKEKFKQLKHNVDVLSLSATPIPRTLNMAMSGIKSMSVIEEVPQNRLPIQTYVLEYDESVIVSAILKEIKRGGMVFYLHNRIETIYDVGERISKLIPGIRICIAHGRMDQNELTKIWQKLLDHEADILICTTIIETGIDIPFCNTLIVEEADKMGLSQLHQLRGRIGRSDKRAFAYMTYQKGKGLSEVSSKRLSAIKEFTKFGAGFKIALRDLEIRGAGNILGAQQHGHIDSVGYDMYIKLLSEAVAEEKGTAPDLLGSEKCTIDIKTTAFLPESYITEVSNRIIIYKRVAMIKDKESYEDLIDELIDRFGDVPKETINLLNISLSRNLAIKNNITEITQKGEYINIYKEFFEIEQMKKLRERFGKRLIFDIKSQPSLKIKIDKNEDSLNIVMDFLSLL